MPLMAYLAVDESRAACRATTSCDWDWSLRRAPTSHCPTRCRHVADFEERYCYDRFWEDRPGGPSTRYLCCGHALVVVGSAQSAMFTNLRAWRPVAVPPPAFPAVPDRAFPEGRAADVLGPPGAGAQEARHQRPGVGQALQARDPPELRDLPALHAPLLVPRGRRPGAGQGAVPPDVRSISASTRCTRRSRNASTT